MREHILLAKKLLTKTGSIFVQIGDQDVHRIRLLLDEIFGAQNFVSTITFATKTDSSTASRREISGYLLWYSSNKSKLKYFQLFEELNKNERIDSFGQSARVELEDGSCKKLTDLERTNPSNHVPNGTRVFCFHSLESPRLTRTGRSEPYLLNDTEFYCSKNKQWALSYEALDKLNELGRIYVDHDARSLGWKQYEDEVPGRKIKNTWELNSSTIGRERDSVVQTDINIVEKCILMSSQPGDLVFDPSCGSGTTAYCAEKWGRRWITCDTSRVATNTAKQRLLNSIFEYYKLADSKKGVAGDFEYKSVPYINPSVLVGLEPRSEIKLVNRPKKDPSKQRITGPISVETAPAPTVIPIHESGITRNTSTNISVVQDDASSQIHRWIAELLATGIRGTDGKSLRFISLEPLAGSLFIHAIGEIENEHEIDSSARIVVVFGQDHVPLSKTMVKHALQDATHLKPIPEYILFWAYHFNSHATREISNFKWPGVTLLTCQMKTDLLTEERGNQQRSKKRFWLFGEPDASVSKSEERFGDSKYVVKVEGFDYYNTNTSTVESGGLDKVAMWLLDPDYDGRCFFPRQVFYPNSDYDGWRQLALNLNASINHEIMREFKSDRSLPFSIGVHKRAAVKIVDDRGIESLKIIPLEDVSLDSLENAQAIEQSKTHDGSFLSTNQQEQIAIENAGQPTDGSEMLDYYLRHEIMNPHAD